MHLLFLDESGKIDQGGLFALGGIAVRDADWPEIRRVWHETLTAAGWPLDREVKWHGIRKGEVPPAIADAIFGSLAAAPFTAYVTLLDLELGPEREPAFFRSPEDIYATGLMFLAERFHHLLDAEDDLGLIVVDSRFREDDRRLRRFFSDLTKDGTPYMQLPRIIEGLFLGPSHYAGVDRLGQRLEPGDDRLGAGAEALAGQLAALAIDRGGVGRAGVDVEPHPCHRCGHGRTLLLLYGVSRSQSSARQTPDLQAGGPA